MAKSAAENIYEARFHGDPSRPGPYPHGGGKGGSRKGQSKNKEASKKDNIEISRKKWKRQENMDYQNRGGNYPASGKPVAIQVSEYSKGTDALFSFKNTSESAAKSWVKNYLQRSNLPFDEIEAGQAGDYHDDWVDVTVFWNWRE